MPVLPLLASAATAAALLASTATGSTAALERPQRPAPGVPAIRSVEVTVPVVATVRDDGLPRVLPVGEHRVDLPVWEAVNGPVARVEGSVAGAAGSCRGLPLVPGAVVRLRCSLVVRPGPEQVVLTVRARGVVVGRFVHTTGG